MTSDLIMDVDPMAIAADSEKVLKQIKECIEFKDSKGLKTFILEHKLKHQTIFWEVTGDLVNCMTADNLNNHTYFFETCDRCLNYIVENGNPKEILLAVLEQADSFKDDEKFKIILSNVQKVLMKLPSKRHHSLEITMETISAHVEALSVPGDHDLEDKEWQLLDLDPDVSRTHDVVTAYLKFMKPFVLEVSLKNKDADREKGANQIKMLRGYLLQLLHHPLLYIHMRYNPKDDEDERKKSYGRECGEMVVELLQQLCPSFFSLIENEKMKVQRRKSTKKKTIEDTGNENEEGTEDVVNDWKNEKSTSELSVANLLYLVLNEHVGIENFPAVYTNEFLLRFCLPYIKIIIKY